MDRLERRGGKFGFEEGLAVERGLAVGAGAWVEAEIVGLGGEEVGGIEGGGRGVGAPIFSL